MDFKGKYNTLNKSVGTNTCEYIILHHTATGEKSIKGVINTFMTKGTEKSCHFVIDVNGDKYKLGNPEDIMRHAGESKRGDKTGMNKYSIGIEVIGPLSYGFDDRQRKSVKELIIHLMRTYGIPKDRVLRHKDVSPGRKIDIDDRFWNNEFKSWDEWKNAKLIIN